MKQGALPIPRPGPRFGTYPERTQNRKPGSSYLLELVRAALLSRRAPGQTERARFLSAVHEKRKQLQDCDAGFLGASARRLRSRLVMEGQTPALMAECFALTDACIRHHFGFALHDTQLLGGWLMTERRLVEMQTGEGKTLTVALAAAAAALAGIPVHVITANDYLVERDAELLAPVYWMLGLSTGAVTSHTDPSLRPEIYRNDIVYCTASELAFDYLRDQLGQGERNLRGLCMALIDEADSILIDEARMPLILSGRVPNAEQSAFFRQALFLAASLQRNEHYLLDTASRRAMLTTAGEDKLETLAFRMGGIWLARRRREETVCQALAALHLFIKGKHYLVRDNHVVIIDENTGRAMPGRVWSNGLHQLVETKENCPLTEEQQTITQTTFQRFFSRYMRVAGISGTLTEARGTLLAIHGLPVVRVPLHKPDRRIMLPSRVFRDKDCLWAQVVERVRELHEQGRPVLIGTDSVADSESLSARLTGACLPHAVLNARHDAEEAAIVARAGQPGAITVSTNMAGRGTDIRLGEGVPETGGLHVIACQVNDSRRIDRQLYGRCARHGEPGSVEHWYCLGDGFAPLSGLTARLVSLLRCQNRTELPPVFARLAKLAQYLRQRYRRREQWFLYLHEWQKDRQLAFAGTLE